MNDYLDDDENVKAMRETARTVGLTESVRKLHVISLAVISEFRWTEDLHRLHNEIGHAMKLLGITPDTTRAALFGDLQ